MRVLITGAAGFIGYHLSFYLLENGYEVIGYDNLNSYYDISLKKARLSNLEQISKAKRRKFYFFKENLENLEKLDNIFSKYKPKKVINLAAQAGVRYSVENPHTYVQSNVVGFINILECCKKYNIEHLVYASSSSVYGGNTKLPFSELDSVDHPVSIYAATKKSNELMAHTYSHLFSLPATGVRFFTVYGPWGRPDMALFLFTKAIIENKPIRIFNNGNMIRDFTYVADIIQSLVKIMNKIPIKNDHFDYTNPNPSTSWAPHLIFNIGNSEPIQLMEYISAIEEILGKKAKKNYVEMQPEDVRATSADTSLLNEWIDYKPTTSIQYGIREFISWYREFYKV